MSQEPAERLALVTGAAGSVGLAVSRRLLDDGLRVIMVDVDRGKLESGAVELGSRAVALMLDVGDERAVAALCARIAEAHGTVDVLVNNAGVLSNNKAIATTPEEWRRIMGINLDGAFFLCRAWLPGMREKGWGRIVNICSMAAKTGGLTAGTAYTTSKGGLEALTFSLARETAGEGITVNGISPAYINTPMVTEQLTEEQRQALLKQIPVGRFCEPEEVAHVVSFLASPLSGFITGEIIDINGGLHMD